MIAEEEVPAIAKPKQQRLGAIVRNRRFKKLQLLRMGDYFSEEAIKLRHPSMYELYVGMYRQEHPQDITTERPFSQLLESQLMHLEYQRLLAEQQRMSGVKIPQHNHTSHKPINEQDLSISQQNLIDLAELHFLSGCDKNMNYTQIDADESLDDQHLLDQQEEESYFSHNIEVGPSSDTGVQDY